MAATLLTVSSPAPKHDPGLRREGLVQGRNMPAQIARTGVLSGRSKKKRRRAAGGLGQDPGEMVTAGVHLALVRLGLDGCCVGGGEQQEHPLQGGFHGQVEGTKSVLNKSWVGRSPGNAWGPRGSVGSRRETSGLTGRLILLLTFPAQMVAPARLAGGNMGTAVASLILICEGIEEGVVKRKGGVGGAALISGGAEGLMALMMTRMGSQSGAWMMRMKKWAPSMPLEPSCLSRYP